MNMTEAFNQMKALKGQLGARCTATFLQVEAAEYCTGDRFDVRCSLHMPDGVQSWYGKTLGAAVEQATAYVNIVTKNTPPMAGMADVDMGGDAPVTDNADGLDDKLAACLPAMIADATTAETV